VDTKACHANESPAMQRYREHLRYMGGFKKYESGDWLLTSYVASDGEECAYLQWGDGGCVYGNCVELEPNGAGYYEWSMERGARSMQGSAPSIEEAKAEAENAWTLLGLLQLLGRGKND